MAKWLILLNLLASVRGIGLFMSAPKVVEVGKDLEMVCQYSSVVKNLYSVKWYKGGKEFYRYLPGEVPPIQVFPLPGVYVQLEGSNDTIITLVEVDFETAGRYRCEVSAEGPIFETFTDFRDVTVVSLPKKGPVLTGGRSEYNVGDNVRVWCSTGPSLPAANLSWFINGRPVRRSFLRGPVIVRLPGGLETSRLGLEFRLERDHFVEGKVRMKCTSTVDKLYWSSLEEKINWHSDDFQPQVTKADRVLASRSSQDGVHGFLIAFILLIIINYI